MAVLRIAKMGNPILSKVAEPVADPTAPEIRHLAADMQETLEDIGASGLAAPQVFVSKRVVVYLPIDLYKRVRHLAGERGKDGEGAFSVSATVRDILEDAVATNDEGPTPSQRRVNKHIRGKNEQRALASNHIQLEAVESVDGGAAAHAAVRDVLHGRVEMDVAEEQLHIARALAIVEELRGDGVPEGWFDPDRHIGVGDRGEVVSHDAPRCNVGPQPGAAEPHHTRRPGRPGVEPVLVTTTR